LEARHVVQLAKNSFEGSFLTEAEKAKWLGEVEKFASRATS
jgi:adenosine deaminase